MIRSCATAKINKILGPNTCCDCCGEPSPRLHHVWAYGIETYACDECTNTEAVALIVSEWLRKEDRL